MTSTEPSPHPSRPGVALVGYRGTGKSTVGRILADRLGLPLIDADRLLEARFSRPISRVFLDLGEPAFREAEEQALAEATGGPPAVLATGGGAVLRPSNRERLRRFGLVVWLKARPEVLAARLSAGPNAVADRPSLTGAGTLAEIGAVLAARTPLYQSVADAEVTTDGLTADEVAREVFETVGKLKAKGV